MPALKLRITSSEGFRRRRNSMVIVGGASGGVVLDAEVIGALVAFANYTNIWSGRKALDISFLGMS